MGTKITDLIRVTVSIAAAGIRAAAFNKTLILTNGQYFAGRAKSYADLEELAADGIPVTSLLYRAAAKLLSQARKPASFLVGRIDAGDANLTATLNAIKNETDAWYAIIHEQPDLAKASALLIAAWVASASSPKFFAHQVSQAGAKDPDSTTDAAYELEALGYGRTIHIYHNEARPQIQTISFSEDFVEDDAVAVDVNATGTATTVTFDGTTITTDALMKAAIATALAAFDDVESATYDSAKDIITVTTVLAADNALAVEEADLSFVYTNYAGEETVTETQSARLNEHSVAALLGFQLSKPAGSSNWNWKQLAGIFPDELTSEEVAALEAKKCGRYEALSIPGSDDTVAITYGMVMGDGQHPDIIHGTDRVVAAISTRLANIMLQNEVVRYTQKGADLIGSAYEAELGIASEYPYNLIDDYEVTIPAIDTSLRNSRNYSGITATATYQGAIDEVELELITVE